jgi:hypothetical protein
VAWDLEKQTKWLLLLGIPLALAFVNKWSLKMRIIIIIYDPFLFCFFAMDLSSFAEFCIEFAKVFSLVNFSLRISCLKAG